MAAATVVFNYLDGCAAGWHFCDMTTLRTDKQPLRTRLELP
jgi:hypothetical protein